MASVATDSEMVMLASENLATSLVRPFALSIKVSLALQLQSFLFFNFNPLLYIFSSFLLRLGCVQLLLLPLK